jgi:hypothetical protein
MNMKSVVIISITKNNRTYDFSMPVGAPYGEAYDVAFECLNEIVGMSKKAVEQLKQGNEQIDQEDCLLESSED